MTKRARLSRSSDFQRIYRQGRSAASRFLVLYYFERSPGAPASQARLGLSVSKKVGGAVVRNRIKRLLREAFAACEAELPAQYDYVLIARAPLADLSERQSHGEKGIVSEAVRDVFVRADLIASDKAVS
jgi:ribonuclease P protein component